MLARLDSNQDQLIQRLAVHIGARVAPLAAPSAVMVSQTVKDLVAGSGLTFEDSGEYELKGIPDYWHPLPGGGLIGQGSPAIPLAS